MKLAGLLDALRNTERGEWADDLIDQLETAYLEDSSVLEEKIAALTGDIGSRDESISSLKTELYDLSKLIPSDEPVDSVDTDTDTDSEDEDVDPLDELPDIEDFFSAPEDKE